MGTRGTPALIAAGRKRSYRAKAKKEQKLSAWLYQTAADYIAGGDVETGIILRDTAAVSSRMARSYMNAASGGHYEDFT